MKNLGSEELSCTAGETVKKSTVGVGAESRLWKWF